MSETNRRIVALILLTLIYFTSYPEDAQTFTTPLATILNLTQAISPGFYGVVATSILAPAIVKTWGDGQFDRK